MKRSIFLVLLVVIFPHFASVCPFSVVVDLLSKRQPSICCLGGSLDYEYNPPNTADDEELQSWPLHSSSLLSNLPSTYPEGTPAGLRGEAVRSALRSGKCIAWNLQHTPLEFGIVRATGSGCMNFLSNKLSQSFRMENNNDRNDNAKSSSFQQACLLTSKGRLVDQLSVATTPSADMAYIITSPGHKASELFQRMDPFIFPLDQVTLMDVSRNSCIFTLASIHRKDIQDTFHQYIQPSLSLLDQTMNVTLPTEFNSLVLKSRDNSDFTLLIVPSIGLPACAGFGYTFCFLNDTTSIGLNTLSRCTSEVTPDGPILIGAREFETLRIETGQPAYGKEITGNERDPVQTPTSPLELHMESMIDQDKGCYLGQEGIASIAKNPRGPPRMLYQIIFEDEFNIYDYQSAGDRSDVENLTRIPTSGDQLFVLGSNEQIPVGYISSIAEPGGTGDAVTLGLALIRRADSILRQMNEMGLVIIKENVSLETGIDNVIDAEIDSDVAFKEPKDPLDGLEVIIGGSFTVGTLKPVAKLLFRGRCMFSEEFPTSEEMSNDNVVDARWFEETASPTKIKDDTDEELRKALEEVKKAEEAADLAAIEARRKADKLDQLRRQAEEAMARRQKQKKD